MNPHLFEILVKKYRYTWIIFGLVFTFIAYNWKGTPNQEGENVLNLTGVFMLMMIYFLESIGAAFTAEIFLKGKHGDGRLLLFQSSLKTGILFAILNLNNSFWVNYAQK